MDSNRMQFNQEKNIGGLGAGRSFGNVDFPDLSFNDVEKYNQMTPLGYTSFGSRQPTDINAYNRHKLSMEMEALTAELMSLRAAYHRVKEENQRLISEMQLMKEKQSRHNDNDKQ